MRVLCSTTPMDGAFGPFVPLGRALVQRGHELVVATGVNLRDRVEENRLSFAAAGLSAWDGVREAMADGQVAAAGAGDRIAFPAAMFGWAHPKAKLPELRRLAESRPFDLVVHPPVDLSGPLLAAELGIPSACYGFGQTFDPRVVRAIEARVRPLWEDAHLEPEPDGGLYRGLYLDPCPPTLRVDPAPASRLGNQGLRPEIPGHPEAELPGWAKRLGSRPVVYVSLGTAPLFNQPEKFAPLLEGLAEEAVDVVVTVSDLNDPAALGELPANVHVERWLPLAPLLPRCSLVVCHAGTGTTLAALVAGLPLVLVPQGADQFDNARACQRAGVAAVLQGEDLSASAVREAVRTVLPTSSAQRTAARRMAQEIAAMPEAGAVVERLESIIEPLAAAR